MNGVGRITENKWMRRLRSDLRIVLDLILRSDLRFGPAQNKHLVVRTDGHWPFRASGLLEPLARLAKEGEKIGRASGPAGQRSMSRPASPSQVPSEQCTGTHWQLSQLSQNRVSGIDSFKCQP